MKTTRGQLTGTAIRDFALAGNATLTVQNPNTGNRFTFKIRCKTNANGKKSPHFVSVLNGSDNYSNYAYIGFIRDDKFIWGGGKAKAGKDSPSVKAFIWFWNHIGNPAPAEVWHEGKCGRCGRKLTVPESIERGIGPECAKLNGAAGAPKKAQPKPAPADDRAGRVEEAREIQRRERAEAKRAADAKEAAEEAATRIAQGNARRKQLEADHRARREARAKAKAQGQDTHDAEVAAIQEKQEAMRKRFGLA